VKSVVPIATPNDPNNPDNIFGYTQFQVNFAPRTAVGTYSYSIAPNVQEKKENIRSRSFKFKIKISSKIRKICNRLEPNFKSDQTKQSKIDIVCQ